MTFVQLIDCRTSRFDEMNRLMDTWVEQTKGKRTATHSVIGKDRSDASHFVEIVEFPSYEEAMRNSGLPETDEDLPGDGGAVRGDAHVHGSGRGAGRAAVRGDGAAVPRGDRHEGRTAAAQRSARGGLPRPRSLQRAGRHRNGRDPADVEEWRRGFDFEFTVEDQIAQGDRVCTRWTWNGTHKGDFLGIPSSGRAVRMTGTTFSGARGREDHRGVVGVRPARADGAVGRPRRSGEVGGAP